MKITLWGTRGSLASPGPDTVRYGGNTSCVSIESPDAPPIALDAGSGIHAFGRSISPDTRLVHIFLTHLHMDHVVGLPFFLPLMNPDMEVHIWGPASTTQKLEARIQRYLSPPLFPVRIRDIPSLVIHDLPLEPVEIADLTIIAKMIIHPNPTVGYRIKNQRSTVTYLPDHEPALTSKNFSHGGEWTSGYDLAEGSDLLIHDAQFTPQEYLQRMGYGHSSLHQAVQFSQLCQVRSFVPFHHDPSHTDDQIDQMIAQVNQEYQPRFTVTPGKEGTTFLLE
jgi:phosphoribosyl 1,2-cyclic phosphodiesterase